MAGDVEGGREGGGRGHTAEPAGRPHMHTQVGDCKHVKDQKSFMESPQCLEDTPEATVSQDMCLPSREVIARPTHPVRDRQSWN